MFLFSLILIAFSQRLDYTELESFNSELSNYLNRKTNEENLEEAIDNFDKQEDSDKYILLIDSVQQAKNFDLDKVAENNGEEFFAIHSQKKILNLTYILPEDKCIKEIKLKAPQNLSKDNQCHWVNNLKNEIHILKRKTPFQGEWKSDECINMNKITIISKFPHIDLKDFICFGDLEISD